MKANILEEIRNTKLFKNFDQETLKIIFDNYKHHFYIKNYGLDEIIYLQSQKCNAICQVSCRINFCS